MKPKVRPLFVSLNLHQAMTCFIVSLVVMLVSCRQRSSDLSFKDGLGELLDLSRADLKTRVDICSRNIFVVYVGNAEGLGRYVLTPAARKEFSARDLLAWEALEEQREEEYFAVIKAQRQALIRRFSQANKPCLDILEEIRKQGKMPGSVFLLTIIDGPNHRAQNDSEISTLSFRFEENQWTPGLEKHWQLKGENVSQLKDGDPIEILMPRDLGVLVKWAKSLGQAKEEIGRAFDQSIFLMKSHGGKFANAALTKIENLPVLRLNDRDEGSVFMFDRHDERGLISTSNYFIPTWTPRTICQRLSKVEVKDLNGCIEKLNKTMKVSIQQVKTTNEDNTQGPITDTQGPNKSEEQGAFSGPQGITNVTLNLDPHEFNPLSEFTIHSANSQHATQGLFGVGDIWGGDRYHLRPNLEDTRTPYKITFPLQETALLSTKVPLSGFDGFPEGFRFLGEGLEVNLNFLFDDHDARADYPKLVLLDTCSGNIGPSNELAPGRINPRLKSSLSSLVLLSNPMPLLINAVDYGLIDSFQQAWLTDLIDELSYDEPHRDPYLLNTALAAVEKLMIDPKIFSVSTTVPMARLKANIFKPTDAGVFNSAPGGSLVMLQQFILTLKHLKEIFNGFMVEDSLKNNFTVYHGAVSYFSRSILDMYATSEGDYYEPIPETAKVFDEGAAIHEPERAKIFQLFLKTSYASRFAQNIYGPSELKDFRMIAGAWRNFIDDLILRVNKAPDSLWDSHWTSIVRTALWEQICVIEMALAFRTDVSEQGEYLDELVISSYDTVHLVNSRSSILPRLKPYVEKLKKGDLNLLQDKEQKEGIRKIVAEAMVQVADQSTKIKN